MNEPTTDTLLDVPGLFLGHAEVDSSGVSVVVCPDGAVAAVDVRGEDREPERPTCLHRRTQSSPCTLSLCVAVQRSAWTPRAE